MVQITPISRQFLVSLRAKHSVKLIRLQCDPKNTQLQKE